MKHGLIVILCLIIASCSAVLYSFVAYGNELKAETAVNKINETAGNLAHDVKEKARIEEKKAEEKERNEETETVNEEDADLLARLITAEAGSESCSYEMRLYVGSVVLNRIASSEFPDTLEGVIYQEGQFQCTTNGMINMEAYDEPRKIAERLLKEGSALPGNVLYFAEFTQGSGIYEQLQNLYFCYE